MNEILKRLEIIKQSIDLEDTEIIEIQVNKLKQLDCDEDILKIIALVNKQKYEKLSESITQYLNKYKNLSVYVDPEISGLKLELKVLEKKIKNLSSQKQEYMHVIEEFNYQSNKELGTIIEEILILRQKILEHQFKSDPALEDEYQEATEEYENFRQQHQDELDKSISNISSEQKKELKKLYKLAAKLCHPDIVTEENKKEAENIFKELNEAYSQNNIKLVEEMLNKLNKNIFFDLSSNKLNNKELLKSKIIKLTSKVQLFESDIESILKSDSYQTIICISDWNEYFNTTKSQLLNEKIELLKTLENLVNSEGTSDNE